eukprot:scaffold72401_cov20-Tisochrysis_lutea.AAC.1
MDLYYSFGPATVLFHEDVADTSTGQGGSVCLIAWIVFLSFHPVSYGPPPPPWVWTGPGCEACRSILDTNIPPICKM